jgi:fluoroquinolone transport system permease protein
MRRFAALLAADVRLQFRYGLYTVSIAMVLIWGALLGALTQRVELNAALLVPPFVSLNLLITTFYFFAALVLFERADGVLTALAVTPLRHSEYLLSKALSLAVLATAETLLIVAFLFGSEPRWALLVAGTLLLSVLFALAGFVAVIRFDSINSFLFPSAAATVLLLLPLLAHFGLIPSLAMILHPAQPAIALIAAATAGDETRLAPAMIAGAVAWIALLTLFSVREYERFVVRRG